jgi:hypothetical protein
VVSLRATVTTDTDKTGSARLRPASINAPDSGIPDSNATNAQVEGLSGAFESVTPGLNPSPNCV